MHIRFWWFTNMLRSVTHARPSSAKCWMLIRSILENVCTVEFCDISSVVFAVILIMANCNRLNCSHLRLILSLFLCVFFELTMKSMLGNEPPSSSNLVLGRRPFFRAHLGVTTLHNYTLCSHTPLGLKARRILDTDVLITILSANMLGCNTILSSATMFY